MLRVLPAPAVETVAAASVAAPSTETTDVAESNERTSLPQVGEATPEADTAAEVAATVEALETDTATGSMASEAAGPEIADTMAEPEEAEMVADTAAEGIDAIAQITAADSELSIDVLRAMQGSLSRGQKRALQQKLRNLGYYRGLIDGIFGPQTAGAISTYQNFVGAKVTGVLTPIQLESLSE